MMRRASTLALATSVSTLPCFFLAASAYAADWLEFRGPGGRGIAPTETIRTTWSEDDGISWRADLPGKGASSPIVVGDLVVVTASSGPRQDRLHVLACDRATGDLRWQRTFWATGRTLCHPTSAVAAGTPASDGTRIVALFSSCDLFALDRDGRLLWQRNLAVEHPRSGNDVGMGTSPRIIDGTVVVQIDCQGDAFAVGIDAVTGSDRWTVPRQKIAGWSTPLAIELPEHGACVALQNPNGLELRRARDGVLVWSWKGDCSGIPMTTEAGGMLYVPNDGLAAVTPTTAEAAPAWRSTKLACGIASPLAWGDAVATINRAGVLTVATRSDGELRGQVRLAGSFWASPLLVGESVVAVNKEGATFLVSIAGEPKVTTENQLPGTFTATPAIADGSLYLRSETTLWKIAPP
ncbi:pyrrolo-quinoline quinone [bacterium]|nr:pyrrolo-quinoline quinone [bacterium]